ncbi:MAG: TetR/AcrR family transcriptional regulator [Rhodospirillales bacterium]|nr:TetR/AcrR family transcriptional regulator [Rhodospirillales bacterium]
MPWKKKFNEEEVLEKAMLAFWRGGFEATSMKNLVDCMGINPGSIYAAFGSKKVLFQRTLELYEAQSNSFLAELEKSHTPRQAIMAMFEHMATDVRDNPDGSGCFLVNSVVESVPKDGEIERIVRSGLDAFDGFMRRMIIEGQKMGEINGDLDPVKTARILHGLVAGGRALSKGRPDYTIMQDIVEHVDKILG